MWCERLVLLVVSLLLAGSCAGQWAVVKGYRVVMKADIVRDFPGMCYDVSSCSARAINESWAIGACSRAACEMDESGILLEVHYTCPRLQNRPTLLCDIIEDKRLPFPACCPRMICQRHKKPQPATQTQLKPFTPHVSVDKELRKIPFVLKRFLEVQNTTLLDAIILNRIKALEAAANNASIAGDGAATNASLRNAPNLEEFVDMASLTTQGPGVTTQDTTPFGTTDGPATTSSPLQRTDSPVEIIRGPGFQSDSLQHEPQLNVTGPAIDDDDELFLNDAPVVPSSEAESTTRSSANTQTATPTKKASAEDVTELSRTAVFASERTYRPIATVTTELPNEPTTETDVETTTKAVGLTVPESIFGTTTSPSTEPPTTEAATKLPATTEASKEAVTTKKQTEAGKKSGNLPTILRSLVDNVFDYYDYIDYYVPGQKRNLTSLPQDRAGDRRRIPESMMVLVKEQLNKQKDTNESSLFVGKGDLQADQPVPKDDPESTTPDPDNRAFQKELVTKMAVDIPRVTKKESQDTTTTFARTEAVTLGATRADLASVTTTTAGATEVTARTTGAVTDRSTDTTTQATVTDTTLTLVKSVASQPRQRVNLAIENLSAEKPEDRTTTGFPESAVTTASFPQTTLTQTTLSRTTTAPTTLTSSVTTQEVTTAAVTTTKATVQPETSRQPVTTQGITRSFQTTGQTETVFVDTANARLAGTTQPAATTTSPTATVTTAAPSTTTVQQTTITGSAESTRPTTSTESITSTSGTRLPQTVSTRSGTGFDSNGTTPEVQTTIQDEPKGSRTVPVLLLTTPEPATASVTATPTPPSPTSSRSSERPVSVTTNPLQANLLKDETQPQRVGNTTTKGQPTPPTNNNDVEYIDYVYYYDYVDTPDNSTANGTSTSSRNGTAPRPTQLPKKVSQ